MWNATELLLQTPVYRQRNIASPPGWYFVDTYREARDVRRSFFSFQRSMFPEGARLRTPIIPTKIPNNKAFSDRSGRGAFRKKNDRFYFSTKHSYRCRQREKKKKNDSAEKRSHSWAKSTFFKVYHCVPKYRDHLHTIIQYKLSSHLGTEWYQVSGGMRRVLTDTSNTSETSTGIY